MENRAVVANVGRNTVSRSLIILRCGAVAIGGHRAVASRCHRVPRCATIHASAEEHRGNENRAKADTNQPGKRHWNE